MRVRGDGDLMLGAELPSRALRTSRCSIVDSADANSETFVVEVGHVAPADLITNNQYVEPESEPSRLRTGRGGYRYNSHKIVKKQSTYTTVSKLRTGRSLQSEPDTISCPTLCRGS